MSVLVNCIENDRVDWTQVFFNFKNYQISNLEVKRESVLNLVYNEKGVEAQFYKEHQLFKVPMHWHEPSFLNRLKKGLSKKELFSKAIKVKSDQPLIFDMTGGLGFDALMMARMGNQVVVFEQNPFLFDILSWNLARGFEDVDLQFVKDSILKLILGDSIQVVKEWSVPLKKPDLIYLDPMFPAKKKKSLAPKEMQLLQLLLEHNELEEKAQFLLDVSLEVNVQKVVLKRPLKSAALIPKPRHQFFGKTIRYDIYS